LALSRPSGRLKLLILPIAVCRVVIRGLELYNYAHFRVAFAPVKPAEFIVLQIQQQAGNTSS
jgi:hypothetical protein